MRRIFAAFAVIGLTAGSAFAADRSAADILKEIEAVKMPVIDRTKTSDRAWVEQYLKEARAASASRTKLIGELYKVDPKNEKLVTLLPQRWQGLMGTAMTREDLPKLAKEVAAEAAAVKAAAKDTALKTTAGYFIATSAIQGNPDAPETMAAIESFIKDAPKDQRAPQLLYSLGNSAETDATTVAAFKKLLADFPDSRFAASAKGSLRKFEGVGKPFELKFTEATKGSEVSIAGLKGKVVVIDFWATWCGPCIAEMPKMKELYAKYRDQGVEFIGVSLDQPKDKGGLDKLLAYVKDNKVEWPQYYQGNFWQSEFSSSWGVNSIPCVFIIDADGKLHSVKARGKLEKLIPELLEKRKNSKA